MARGGFDMHEVRALAADLLSSEGPVREGARRSIKAGATRTKADSRRAIRAAIGGNGGHAKHYPRAIDFDILDDGLAAEIGPSIGNPQAFLGKILEYGTATSPPHPHLIPAAENEQERIAQGLADAVTKALRGAGL